jgi:hypothetical protein
MTRTGVELTRVQHLSKTRARGVGSAVLLEYAPCIQLPSSLSPSASPPYRRLIQTGLPLQTGGLAIPCAWLHGRINTMLPGCCRAYVLERKTMPATIDSHKSTRTRGWRADMESPGKASAFIILSEERRAGPFFTNFLRKQPKKSLIRLIRAHIPGRDEQELVD